MWTARSYIEAAALFLTQGHRALCLEIEREPDAPAPPVLFKDLSQLYPEQYRKLKLGSTVRQIARVEPYKTIHVTAVTGGYGASKRAIKRHDGDVIAAIEERYAKIAYHDLASRVGGGTDYKIHPPTRRTAHGGEGNKGMGWAVDCGNKEELSAGLRDASVVSLSRSILDQREYSDEPIIMVPHRVWTKGRRGDTHIIVWRTIVMVVADVLGPDVCRIGYEVAYKRKGGRQIPRSWDPNALYDDKGRRL